MISRHPKKITKILVTAGPTREKIDPIRFISNYSTGVFGYEVARRAREMGKAVTLISGPTELKTPRGVKVIRVESALEMRRAVMKEFPKVDCLVMAAAVSDWRPSSTARRKIKKTGGMRTLKLEANPDILAEAGRKKDGRVLVGFVLETEDLIKNARRKMREKNADLMVANRLGPSSGLFGEKRIDLTVIDKFGGRMRLRRKTKREAANIILDKISALNI